MLKEIKKEVKEKTPEVEVRMPKVVIEKKPEVPVEVSFAETDSYKLLLSIIIVIFIGTAVFVIGAGYIILKK